MSTPKRVARLLCALAAFGAAATVAAGELTPLQKARYDRFNGEAKSFCEARQTMWEAAAFRAEQLMGDQKEPVTLIQHKAISDVWAARSSLAECKGDYWLHLLTTADAPKPATAAPKQEAPAPRRNVLWLTNSADQSSYMGTMVGELECNTVAQVMTLSFESQPPEKRMRFTCRDPGVTQ